jgi:hypothetical protein
VTALFQFRLAGFSWQSSVTTVFSGLDGCPEERAAGGGGAPFAVFWNMYLPEDVNRKEEVVGAAKEQMRQVGTSFATSLPNQPLTVYFNTIGSHGYLNGSSVSELCLQYDNMKCQHMHHYGQGFEEVTLDKLYDYCQEEGREAHRVAYIHNKGSYNPIMWEDPDTKRMLRKDVWRRHLTAAAVHEMCLRPPDDKCNVCGVLWTPVPWQHVRGVSGRFLLARGP